MTKAENVIADIILFPAYLMGLLIALGLIGAFLALVGFGLSYLWSLIGG